MKKNSFLFGVFVVMLVLGMITIGCSNGSTDPDDSGIFTVTGIPEVYNGSYAFFEGETYGGDDNLLRMQRLQFVNNSIHN